MAENMLTMALLNKYSPFLCRTIQLTEKPWFYLLSRANTSRRKETLPFKWQMFVSSEVKIYCVDTKGEKRETPKLEPWTCFSLSKWIPFFVKWMFWTYSLTNNGFIVCYFEKWCIQIWVSLEYMEKKYKCWNWWGNNTQKLFLWNYQLRVMHSFLSHISNFFNLLFFLLAPGSKRDHAKDV